MFSKSIQKNWQSTKFSVAMLCIAVVMFFIGSAHVSAEDGSGSQQTLRNTNNFYAYVGNGENLDVSIERVRDDGPGAKHDVTVIISRPGAADVSCQIPALQPNGSSCDWSNLTASSAGIWRVRFEVPDQTFEYHSWEINVQNGSINIPGRVWSNAYYFSQNGDSTDSQQATNSPDIKMWYKSEIGYLYEVDYLDYFGIDSIFQANSFGIVEDGTCNTIYKSVPIGQSIGGGVNPDQVVQNCGGEYKVFFDQPASDLPQRAQRWDGTEDWINTNSIDPTIQNLNFTPQSQGVSNGTLAFSTTDYVGSALIRVDANNNGVFSDPVDRIFSRGVRLGQNVSLQFDGKDGNGNTIPGDQKLSFQVNLGRIGEIHFVNTDPEKRGGGIQVERHTGSASGRNILYWDDRDFSGTTSLRCSTTPALNGTAGVDSTGGVHGWGITSCANFGNNNTSDESVNNGSWGDTRYIHDWTYAPTPIITASYVYLPDVYVECITEIGSPCTTPIPEFCVPDILTAPREGSSTVEGGNVTYTPNGNVADEENYVHLRQSEDAEARCFVKIKFIPKGANAGASGTNLVGTVVMGSAVFSLAGFGLQRLGGIELLKQFMRK